VAGGVPPADRSALRAATTAAASGAMLSSTPAKPCSAANRPA
jgi:hypothetical protein